MIPCNPLLCCVCQHVFVGQTGLTRRLAVDLLDRMNNPDNHQHYSEVDDDDLEVTYNSVTYSLTWCLKLEKLWIEFQNGCFFDIFE